MSNAELPAPDQISGAPHPRETPVLYGQQSAESTFLNAFSSGRLHHAWLLTGPQGVGKATLAWHIARFLLSQPADGGGGLFSNAPPVPRSSLDIDASHPVSRRIAALAEPGLFLLRRGPNDKGDRLMATIGVDEVRKLNGFFALSSADGGRRVVIVDAADELNTSAANALLKVLEEPPRDVVMLLISHQPARLLPTIRSRCRTLRLAALEAEDLARAVTAAGFEVGDHASALAELAGGSVGMAVQLLALDGLALYADLIGLIETCPRLDRQKAVALSDRLSGRADAEKQDLAFTLIGLFLGRLARTGAGHFPPADAAPHETDLLRRLSPDNRAAQRWASLQADLSRRNDGARAVNLDPSSLILDTMLRINETSGALTARV